MERCGNGHFLQDNFLLYRKTDLDPEIVCKLMIQSDIYFRVRLYPINIHNYNMEIVNTKPQKEKKDGVAIWEPDPDQKIKQVV